MRGGQVPAVSVVLPVWNGEAFLAQAIESICRQTLSSFELIVIDDGSTDGTAAIADDFGRGDYRIRVIHRSHEGLPAALNAGIAAARAGYVARMDADDVSLRDRLRKQVAYLEKHPSCVAVGGWIEVVDEAEQHIGLKRFATAHDAIYAALLRGFSPIAHPTIVARRHALRAAGGYDPERFPSEDLDLWFRLGERGELANLGEVVLQHRRHKAAVGVLDREKMQAMAFTVCNEARSRHGLPVWTGMPAFAGGHVDARAGTHVNIDAQYHFECARTALMTGPRLTAIRHAAATIAAEPDRLYGYITLSACAIPKPLLRFMRVLQARWR